jgi:hypothetical protein
MQKLQCAVPANTLPCVASVPYHPDMNIPRRKTLPHEIPLWLDPQKEVYFITINCEERFKNQLALPDVAERLFETVCHRQEKFCGGRICSCSCPTICTHYFPFHL